MAGQKWKLIQLALDWNFIGDVGAKAIAKGMFNNLESLSLIGNKITSESL